MHLLPLLGRKLKDDDVVDVLEAFDMEVVYNFDRLREGQPDEYWASSKAAGIQLRFDAAQTLDVIFLDILPSEGFAAFSRKDCDIPFFMSTAEVQSFGEAQQMEVLKGSTDFIAVTRDWVRLEFATHSVHYEYREGNLALVTVTRKQH